MNEDNHTTISEVEYPDLLKIDNYDAKQHEGFENELKAILERSGNKGLVRKEFKKLGKFLSQDVQVWKSSKSFGQNTKEPVLHYYRVKNTSCNLRLYFVYLVQNGTYIFLHAFIERDENDHNIAVAKCENRIKEVMQEYNCAKEDFLC